MKCGQVITSQTRMIGHLPQAHLFNAIVATRLQQSTRYARNIDGSAGLEVKGSEGKQCVIRVRERSRACGDDAVAEVLCEAGVVRRMGCGCASVCQDTPRREHADVAKVRSYGGPRTYCSCNTENVCSENCWQNGSAILHTVQAYTSTYSS